MHDTNADGGRIDRDHYEPSPSTGPEETLEIMDAITGADHTATCEYPECDREDVTLDSDSQSMFCEYHMKHAETRRCSS